MRGQPVFVTQTALCRICIWPGCFVQVTSRVWKLGQACAKSLLTRCVAQAAAGSCKNCPKRPAKAALKNSREHVLTLSRSEKHRSVPDMSVGMANATHTRVARSIEPISKRRKFMSNQTTVPNPNAATPLPAGANAPQRPTGDSGGAPKLLTPAASTSATTNPPAATQAPKPPPGRWVQPASGNVRKSRSGRSH